MPRFARGEGQPLSWDGHTSLKTNASISALNTLANSATNSRAEKARAIFTVFANYVSPSQTAKEVHTALTDTRWLKQANLEGVYALDGWIPIEMGGEDTVFCLYLFADEKGWSDWVIYFRLSGLSLRRKEDGLAFLRGESLAGNPKILEFALCFPGGSHRGRERIERFGPKGSHIYDFK